MEREEIRIGLFGFGCVGKGLYEVIGKTPGLQARVLHIVVKDPHKARSLPAEKFSYDKNKILLDPAVNVVVELIDDATAAYEIVTTALRSGKHVVSANKKMIAEHLEELIALQREHQVSLLYEAACCASIPIIRNLEEYYDNDLLESIGGIVNGSTNYILSQAEKGAGFAAALEQAQALGYAESDPFLDVSGLDAKYKLQILLAHAFGKVTRPFEIFNLGIDRITDADLKYAREKNLRVKLVANAYRNSNGKLAAYVMPALVGTDNRLHQVDDVFNGVVTRTCFADTQFFMGRGAGAFPTASAVLSDLSALSYGYKYEYKKINGQEKLAAPAEVLLRVYAGHSVDIGQRVRSRFIEVEESFHSAKRGHSVGIISLEKIIEITALFGGACSFLLMENITEQMQPELQVEWVEEGSQA